jgi:hypothetical protein
LEANSVTFGTIDLSSEITEVKIEIATPDIIVEPETMEKICKIIHEIDPRFVS